MNSPRQRLPIGGWLFAIALIGNGIFAGWALLQTLLDAHSVFRVDGMGNETQSLIAYAFISLMSVCFLVAGLSLLFLRKRAIVFFVAGVIGYFGYGIFAYLIPFMLPSWDEIKEGAVDPILIAFAVVGSLFAFGMVRAMYWYLRSLSEAEVLT